MEVESMTTQLVTLGRNKKKERAVTPKVLLEMHKELEAIMCHAPYGFKQQSDGTWLLLITEARANFLGLKQRRFNIKDPRQAPEILRKAFPQN